MAGITRTSGYGQFAQGTVYSVAQLKAFIIDAQAALTTEDDGAVREAMEAIISEVQPLMYYSAGTAQTITVICDGHGVDAASLQIRLRNLDTTGGFTFTGVTVNDAASVTAAA